MKAANIFHHSRRSASGFTLLELMAAVTVFAILLGIGIPSLNRMMRANQLSAQVNELITALNMARSEATTRGIRVSLCPADLAQEACNDTADWTAGWILFTDDLGAAAGTVEEGDEILQAWPATETGFALNPAPASVTFLPSRAAAAATFDIYATGCSDEEKRRVKVDNVGRISLSKENCS